MIDESFEFGNNPILNSEWISQKIRYLQSLADQQWWIFPLHDLTIPFGVPHCGCNLGTRCPGPGKHPLGKWSEPLDPANPLTRSYIDASVNQWPSRGWGLHVGLSGLAILDVDPRNGGQESLAKLARELGIVLANPTVSTGGGGAHYYYHAPAGCYPRRGFVGANGQTRCTVQLAPGLELFFGQHYVVLPYSPHKSGGWYGGVNSVPLQPLPPPLFNFVSLLEVFRVKERAPTTIPETQLLRPNSTPISTDTTSENRATRAAAWLLSRDPAISGDGGRAKTVSTATELLIGFDLDMPTAWQLMVDYNSRCLPPWSLDQLREIMAWADGRPGERGSKLRQRTLPISCGPDLETDWMGDMALDILMEDFVHHSHPDGTYSIEALPAKPAITAEELESLGNGPLKVTVIQIRDRSDQEGPRQVGNSQDCIVPIQQQDYFPAADAAHAPPCNPAGSGAFGNPCCNCAFQLLLHQPQTRKVRVLRLPGRRWDCPVCGPIRREHYRATIRHHLREWAESHGGMDSKKLFLTVCPRDQWPVIASSIRVRRGQFFKIDHCAMGDIKGESFLVMSTVPTSHVAWVLTSPTEAAKTLCEAIDSVPSDIAVRIWWSSRHWQLLPDRDPKPPEWERVGRLTPSWECITDVLGAWELPHENISGSGRFWRYYGLQFKYQPGQWSDLCRDLSDGEPLSKMNIEIGLPGPYDWPGSDGAGLGSNFL